MCNTMMIIGLASVLAPAAVIHSQALSWRALLRDGGAYALARRQPASPRDDAAPQDIGSSE